MRLDNTERTRTVLLLPELREEATPGASVVRRATSLLLGVLGGVLVLAIVLAVVIRVDISVDASGVIEPTHVWPVRSTEPGNVTEVLVNAGDRVTPGQPLVRLDTLQLGGMLAQLRTTAVESRLGYEQAKVAQEVDRRQLDERARQADAALLKARAALRQRMADYRVPDNVDSVVRTYRRGTSAALDLATADVSLAESELRSIDAQRTLAAASPLTLEKQRASLRGVVSQIGVAEARLARLVIRAPAAGVVLTERLHEIVGGFVREGDQLMEVADPTKWKAVLRVTESDLHEIRIGDPVNIELLAFPRNRDLLHGRVSFVAEQQTGGTGSEGGPGAAYRIVVDIDSIGDVQRHLRRGFTVRARIVSHSGRVTDVLWRRATRR